jgi:glycosyltransferase involved in cell wall biosynthesis
VKKRILYIEGAETIGGSVVCLNNIVTNLDKNSYEAIIIFLFKGAHVDLLNDQCKKNIIISLSNPFQRQTNSKIVLWIEKRCFLVKNISKIFNKINRFIFQRIRQIASILFNILKYKVSIIHLNNGLYYPSIILARLFHIPCLCYLRSTVNSLPFLSQTLGKLATSYIAVSRGVKDSYIKLGFPAEKIAVIYDGIDRNKLFESVTNKDRFYNPCFSHSGNKIIIGTVTRLDDPKKGLDFFIDSIPLILNSHPESKFIIVGGDKNGKTLEFFCEKIRKLGLENKVTFTGFQKNAIYFISQMDIFVLPSIQPKDSLGEGLPIVVLEAMALGKPVVASRLPGILEIFTDKSEGLFVEPGNAASIATAILHLIDHPDITQKLSRNAIKLIDSKYTLDHFIKKIDSLYKQVSNRT